MEQPISSPLEVGQLRWIFYAGRNHICEILGVAYTNRFQVLTMRDIMTEQEHLIDLSNGGIRRYVGPVLTEMEAIAWTVV